VISDQAFDPESESQDVVRRQRVLTPRVKVP